MRCCVEATLYARSTTGTAERMGQSKIFDWPHSNAEPLRHWNKVSGSHNRYTKFDSSCRADKRMNTASNVLVDAFRGGQA